MFWSRRVDARDRARFGEIERCIASFEKETDAEIVPVLVSESHDYAYYEFRLTIIMGLLAFLASLIWLKPIENLLRTRFWDYDSAHLVLFCGGSAFILMLLVYLLVNIPALDRLIIPGRVMAERVHERALRAFAESKVSHTENRLGLLFFVSLLEQRVEILADRGVAERIGPEIWQGVVSDMSPVMKAKGLVDGLLHGIGKAGPFLVETFPQSENQHNRLADQLTLMER